LHEHGEEGTDELPDKVSPVKITKGRNEKKRKLTDEDEDSEDDSDEEFPNDKILRGKDMKKGKQADVDIVPPEKKAKKAKKSPNKVPKPRLVWKVIRKWNVRRTRMNPECTNYGEIHENCIVCVEESTDKENVVAIRKNGHVWMSVCEEFYEILKEKEVLEEVKEVMRRAKNKKS